VLHVVEPGQVDVVGQLDPFNRRACYGRATVKRKAKGIDWTDQESIVIELQVAFAPEPERERLLKLVSSATAEELNISDDDGIAQTVTTRAKAGLANRETVGNPFNLSPLGCEFPEVGATPRPYVLRARRGRGSGLEFGLFQVVDPTVDARLRQRIAEWLAEETAAHNETRGVQIIQ
jgi:hypothetical protein